MDDFVIDLRITRSTIHRIRFPIASQGLIEQRFMSVKVIALGLINIVVWWSSRMHIRLFHNVGGVRFIGIRTVMILAWESACNTDPTIPNRNSLYS